MVKKRFRLIVTPHGHVIDVVKPRRTCVVCGRSMVVRKLGTPWHPRCGKQGGME